MIPNNNVGSQLVMRQLKNDVPRTVTQVNTYIKAILDESAPLKYICVQGEISNFVHYYKSGHMYFTLKDDKSVIKAVMFSTNAQGLHFEPKNGMNVICFGKVSVYEKDGIYQIYVQKMITDEEFKLGSIALAIEDLKKKLSSKGYFDETNKKPIPKYPKTVGVATSNMGAAVEDIKNILNRRFPLTNVVIVPTIVQGENSGQDIAKSIEYLDSLGYIDVIIVGRGGGSIEDLWGFNTQAVADAVYNCRTPIISAVGHETDTTICDMVADLRAPTPSAAAELAVPDYRNELIHINNLSLGLEKGIDSYINRQQKIVNDFKNNSILANSKYVFDKQSSSIDVLSNRLNYTYNHILDKSESNFARLLTKLDAYSPLSVLSRGYAIASKNNKSIKSIDDLSTGDEVSIKLKDGVANATINEVISNG